MAAPTLITRQNFLTGAGGNPLLVRSTNPRGSSPNGNVYFDTANDQIQLISLAELATVDLGGGAEANPLTALTKVEVLAIYFFALIEVEADPALQNFRAALDAATNELGLLVGATSFLNDIVLASGTIDINGVGGELGDDRLKTANSGFSEFSDAGQTRTRVYHGARGVSSVLSTSRPYYLLAASTSEADRLAATPVDFNQLGNPNEVIQTFGDASNGNFDSQDQVLILNVRTFGQRPGETSSTAAGIPKLGPVAGGYPLQESADNDVQALGVTEADVFGGSAIIPYSGMSFARLAAPQVEGGFTQADGNFTDVISNTNGGSLTEVRAFLDVLSAQDTDENTNTGTTGAIRPKRIRTLYDIVNGIVVFRQGLFVENIPTADQQSLQFVDDGGNVKTYPFQVSVIVSLSNAWQADPNGWFRVMYLDGAGALDFDTANAVTLEDAASVAVAGDTADGRIFAVAGGYELRFSYDYDGNTQAGLTAGVDKTVVIQVGGTTSKRRLTQFTIERIATVRADATTEAETN